MCVYIYLCLYFSLSLSLYLWDYLAIVIPFPTGLVDSLVAWTVHPVHCVAPRPIPAWDSDKDLLIK